MAGREKSVMKCTMYRSMVCIAALLVLLLSATVVTSYTTNPEHHKKSIQILDEKKDNVLKLTALTTASSTALTLLPGDVATPIADKLADMSSYFVIILCAVFLEEYLLTITGYAAFRVLIPLAAALLIAGMYLDKERWKILAVRLGICGLLLYAAIPASVKISNMVEQTYETSLQTTIDEAETMNSEIEAETDGESAEEAQTEEADSSFSLNKIAESIGDGISSIATMGEEKAKEYAEKAEKVLNEFIEATAVMLITSCVLPILVVLFFFWMMKFVLEGHFSFSLPEETPRKRIEERKQKTERNS